MATDETTTAEEACAALRAWRIRSRLRQDAIAKCLGVAQSQISRWESGRDLPRPHNVEAIRRLIRGSDVDPLVALKHFVTRSTQHLLLFDDQQNIVARSLPYLASPNPLDEFGWVLDSTRNPAFAPAHRRYQQVMADPAGVVGLSIALPFVHDDSFWLATINHTIHSIAGARLCLAELLFTPATGADSDIRIEEVRFDGSGEARMSVTLWRQPI